MLDDSAKMVERNLGRRHYSVVMRGRTYSAVHHVRSDYWQVENSRGVPLGEWSPTARRVVEMCEAAFQQLEDALA
jgi:hypothetical protein